MEIHLEKGSENVVRFGVEGSGEFEIYVGLLSDRANTCFPGFEATVDGIEVFEDDDEL